MSGKGSGRIDRRRRAGRLRRLTEQDRQRTAVYNSLRGRLTPLVAARLSRGGVAMARKTRKARMVSVVYDEAGVFKSGGGI